MTSPIAASKAADTIRRALASRPYRIITGIGARETLRELTGLSPSQFAKGLAYNLAVYDDIFIVINERRNGSTYMLTSNADLAWLPVAEDGQYCRRREQSLSKKVAVVEEALMKQDAPVSVRSTWYAIHRQIDDAVATLTPAVRQAAYMAGLPEKKIERWMSA